MEQKPNQKKTNSLIPFIFVIIMSLFILFIFVTNGGMNTTEGIGAAGVLIFMIIFALLKIIKLQSVSKSRPVNQPAPLDPSSPVVSGHPTDAVSPNTDSANSTVSQGGSIVGKPLPEWIQNILVWFQKFPKPKQVLMVASAFFVIIIIIIGIITIPGLAEEPNTTITGTWELELESMHHKDWIVLITMFNLDWDDVGYLDLYVNENGTFTLMYGSTLVSQGTWEQTDIGYRFLYVDPIDPTDTLMWGSWDYDLKGSILYYDRHIFYTKKQPG